MNSIQRGRRGAARRAESRPRPPRPALVACVDHRADGHFTMRELHGGVDGDGTLDGEPWKWTAWRSVSRLPDGTSVESTDLLTQDILIAHKRVLGPTGALVVTTTERLVKVSADRFAERRSALIGPKQ